MWEIRELGWMDTYRITAERGRERGEEILSRPHTARLEEEEAEMRVFLHTYAWAGSNLQF